MEATRVNYWIFVSGGFFWFLSGIFHIAFSEWWLPLFNVNGAILLGIGEILFGFWWLYRMYRSGGHVSVRPNAGK